MPGDEGGTDIRRVQALPGGGPGSVEEDQIGGLARGQGTSGLARAGQVRGEKRQSGLGG